MNWIADEFKNVFNKPPPSQPFDFMAGLRNNRYGSAAPYVPDIPDVTSMVNKTGPFNLGAMNSYGMGTGPVAADVSPWSLTPQNLNITMGDATRNFAPAPNLSLGNPASTINGGTGAGINPTQGLGINNWLQENGVTGPNGWGGLALGAASGLMQGYFGMQQLGLAKDQLATQKEQWGLNFGAQQKMTNSRLADRQERRNKEGYGMGAAEYMKKYGI